VKRAVGLHESLLPNRQVGAMGRMNEKGEAPYLFGVSFFSVKRYSGMASFVVNSGQGQPMCRDDEGCALLPDQSPPKCKNPPMARPGQRIDETA
jgi:hypothetical protein